jgi:hypothetical protein
MYREKRHRCKADVFFRYACVSESWPTTRPSGRFDLTFPSELIEVAVSAEAADISRLLVLTTKQSFRGRLTMNSTPTIRALVLSASVLALTAGSTFAQQITGTPGSLNT